MITNLPKNSKQLEELFLSNARPLVGEMNKANELRVYTQRPLLVAYFEVNWKPDENKGERLNV